MRIEHPDMSDTDRLADLWVALAEDQRAYGSYLLPEENRDTIRESVARHIVTGGLLVARVNDDDTDDGDVDDDSDVVDDTDDGADTDDDDDNERDDDDNARDDDANARDDEDVDTDVERIVGFVMFGPETGSFEQDVDKGVIQNVYVVPERRGTGIGRELLEAAEDAMRSDGMESVVLDVMATNERAREFYRRLGYEDHRVTMAKDDVDENDMHSREH